MREFQIEAQRHPGRRDTHDVPCTAPQLTLERSLRRLATAVRIKDFGLDPGRFEHARKPPDPQGRGKKSVFTAVRIVRTDQEYLGQPRGYNDSGQPVLHNDPSPGF